MLLQITILFWKRAPRRSIPLTGWGTAGVRYSCFLEAYGESATLQLFLELLDFAAEPGRTGHGFLRAVNQSTYAVGMAKTKRFRQFTQRGDGEGTRKPNGDVAT